MKRKPHHFWIALGVVLAGGIVLLLLNWNRSELPSSQGETAGTTAGSSDEPLDAAWRRAKSAASPDEMHRALAALREALKRAPSAAAAAWIRGRIEEGTDFATKMDLEIAPDQSLANWPSFRVFLLDALLRINPEAAAAESRKLLTSAGSPDEWAVCLRNLARCSDSAEDMALLRAKSAEMLNNEAWRKAPTAGYLEAFDVIVHARNTDLAPALLDLCADKGNQAVRHAAFLTLDRLMLVKPEACLKILVPAAANRPELALMISNMVARADVSDSVQRRWVEAYVLDPKRTAAELHGFGTVFPNGIFRISTNLVGESPVVDGVELARRDREAVAVLNLWAADARFSHLKDCIDHMKQRLAAVSGAESSPSSSER